MPGLQRADGSIITMPPALYEAELLRKLCVDFNYPGFEAARKASLRVMRYLKVLDMAEPKQSPAPAQQAPRLTDAELDAMGVPQIEGPSA